MDMSHSSMKPKMITIKIFRSPPLTINRETMRKVLIIDDPIGHNLKMVNEMIEKSMPLKFDIVQYTEVKTGREKRRERRKLNRKKHA
jgi:hypoxanthine-guanine phosphoribosyltransferase